MFASFSSNEGFGCPGAEIALAAKLGRTLRGVEDVGEAFEATKLVAEEGGSRIVEDVLRCGSTLTPSIDMVTLSCRQNACCSVQQVVKTLVFR